MCAIVCPHGVLSVVDKKVMASNSDLCMECGACALNCVRDAISVEAGVGCAAAIILGSLRGTEPVCDCGGATGGC